MSHNFAQLIATCVLLFGLTQSGHAQTQTQATPKDFETQVRVHGLWWDLHEVNVAQVKRFAAQTGFVSVAEKEGFGFIYESGWTQKKGWNWRSPFGKLAHDLEPAVQLTFDEAQQICKFQGKRLPTDAEWVKAAYLEQRDNPPAGFVKGQRYPFPNGASAKQKVDSHVNCSLCERVVRTEYSFGIISDEEFKRSTITTDSAQGAARQHEHNQELVKKTK